jgi:hypothetical protein
LAAQVSLPTWLMFGNRECGWVLPCPSSMRHVCAAAPSPDTHTHAHTHTLSAPPRCAPAALCLLCTHRRLCDQRQRLRGALQVHRPQRVRAHRRGHDARCADARLRRHDLVKLPARERDVI